MLVKANKDFEAGTPPNPELMAAVAKLADEATARGVMGSLSHIFPCVSPLFRSAIPAKMDTSSHFHLRLRPFSWRFVPSRV